MVRTVKAVEDYIKNVPDIILVRVQEELYSGVMPKDGHARKFCTNINQMLDDGTLRVYNGSYRKIYLPTLKKIIQNELSHRYIQLCSTLGKIS